MNANKLRSLVQELISGKDEVTRQDEVSRQEVIISELTTLLQSFSKDSEEVWSMSERNEALKQEFTPRAEEIFDAVTPLFKERRLHKEIYEFFKVMPKTFFDGLADFPFDSESETMSFRILGRYPTTILSGLLLEVQDDQKKRLFVLRAFNHFFTYYNDSLVRIDGLLRQKNLLPNEEERLNRLFNEKKACRLNLLRWVQAAIEKDDRLIDILDNQEIIHNRFRAEIYLTCLDRAKAKKIDLSEQRQGEMFAFVSNFIIDTSLGHNALQLCSLAVDFLSGEHEVVEASVRILAMHQEAEEEVTQKIRSAFLNPKTSEIAGRILAENADANLDFVVSQLASVNLNEARRRSHALIVGKAQNGTKAVFDAYREFCKSRAKTKKNKSQHDNFQKVISCFSFRFTELCKSLITDPEVGEFAFEMMLSLDPHLTVSESYLLRGLRDPKIWDTACVNLLHTKSSTKHLLVEMQVDRTVVQIFTRLSADEPREREALLYALENPILCSLALPELPRSTSNCQLLFEVLKGKKKDELSPEHIEGILHYLNSYSAEDRAQCMTSQNHQQLTADKTIAPVARRASAQNADDDLNFVVSQLSSVELNEAKIKSYALIIGTTQNGIRVVFDAYREFYYSHGVNEKNEGLRTNFARVISHLCFSFTQLCKSLITDPEVGKFAFGMLLILDLGISVSEDYFLEALNNPETSKTACMNLFYTERGKKHLLVEMQTNTATLQIFAQLSTAEPREKETLLFGLENPFMCPLILSVLPGSFANCQLLFEVLNRKGKDKLSTEHTEDIVLSLNSYSEENRAQCLISQDNEQLTADSVFAPILAGLTEVGTEFLFAGFSDSKTAVSAAKLISYGEDNGLPFFRSFLDAHEEKDQTSERHLAVLKIMGNHAHADDTERICRFCSYADETVVKNALVSLKAMAKRRKCKLLKLEEIILKAFNSSNKHILKNALEIVRIFSRTKEECPEPIMRALESFKLAEKRTLKHNRKSDANKIIAEFKKRR